MQERLRYQKARRVTLIGAAVNLLLACIKIIFGALGHSQALIADGIHSFSDLLTDGLVLFASRFGSQTADNEHPYGHQRIETMATVGLAVLLILAGFWIIYESANRVFIADHERPELFVLFVAVISIAANEYLYRYTLAAGRRLNSVLLQANAWHHRSDAASSIVVLIGVTGALLGFTYLDAIAAIVVGLMVGKMGWSLGWSSIRELIDTGVTDEILNEIRQAILSVPGIQAIHQLRTRSMGDNILVDVHIMLSPDLSISEGHYIAARVHETLQKEVKKIIDVTIHVDPEDDELTMPTHHLPPREHLLPELLERWRQCPGVDDIENIKLHYLAGKINIELYLPFTLITKELSVNEINRRYQKAIADYEFIESVKVLFY